MESFKEILDRKIEYYGKTEAAYEFAAEEYAIKFAEHYQALQLQQGGVMCSNWIECEKCGLIKNRDKCVPCGCDK